MTLSIERKRAIAVYGAIIILLAAAAIIIIQNPDVDFFPEKAKLQILSGNVVDGRNEGEVNASITIEIKNVGNSNESRVLISSISFRTVSNGDLTYENRTLVTLTPGETRTYHLIIMLPDSAKSVSWSLSTVFED